MLGCTRVTVAQQVTAASIRRETRTSRADEFALLAKRELTCAIDTALTATHWEVIQGLLFEGSHVSQCKTMCIILHHLPSSFLHHKGEPGEVMQGLAYLGRCEPAVPHETSAIVLLKTSALVLPRLAPCSFSPCSPSSEGQPGPVWGIPLIHESPPQP